MVRIESEYKPLPKGYFESEEFKKERERIHNKIIEYIQKIELAHKRAEHSKLEFKTQTV